MARHQGKRKQQLVFHQGPQVQRSGERQHIVLAVGVQLSSGTFALDKKKRTLGIHFDRHRPQAALALEHQTSDSLEVQPHLRLATPHSTMLTLRLPGDFAFRGAHDGRRRQALELYHRPRPIKRNSRLGESLDVELQRIKIARFHGGSLCGRLHRQFLPMTERPPLILGSTSRYRREMLQRLRLPFDVRSPQVDETPRVGEAPAALALRLALAKANDVASRFPQAAVIGSDQVADLEGHPIGKPGDHARATEQLKAMRGKAVVFQTAVAVVCVARRYEASALVPVTVRFRDLSDAEIEHYLRAEEPYDCAGSAKSEGLGITLLRAIESDDPTALVGLPLIRTCDLLRGAGIDPLVA
jgi:septum formation protein